MRIVISISKLNGVAPLIADPPSVTSTTMLGRWVCQDKNVYLDGTFYWPRFSKLYYIFYFMIVYVVF